MNDVRTMVYHAARRIKGAVLEGWYTGDEKSTSRKYMLFFSYSNNIVANLIGANFFTGLLLLIEAGDAFIGTMSMISTAANMLQLFSPLLIERFAKRKKLIITGHVILQLINVLFIGLIPIIPASMQVKLALVAISVITVNIMNAFLAPGMSVWHLQSLPAFTRGPFLSLIAMTVGPAVSVAALIGSRLVDLLKASGSEYAGLALLRGISMLLVGVNIYVLSRIKEYPYSREKRFTLVDLLVKPFKEPRYLMTVAVACLWSFCANLPGPFYTVYLIKNVNVSYSLLMLVSFISVPMTLFLTPVWSRFSRRISWYQMVSIGMFVHVVYYCMLAFVTRSTLFLYPIGTTLVYVAMAGVTLAFNNMPYVNIPERNQTAFIGFYSTMANMGAFLGVTLSRQFIAITENRTLKLFGASLINKQYILLMAAAFMVAGATVILLINKRQKRISESN